MNNLLKHYASYFNKQEGRKYPCSNQVVVCMYITENKQEVFDYLDKNNFHIMRLGKIL